MSEYHEQFRSFLRESDNDRWRAARWLSSQGKTVRLEPMREAPRHEDWEEYADDGDIWVVAHGGERRIEIKRTTYPFTCRHDWPFHGYIVCAKHAYDRAEVKPDWFFMVNPDWTHGGWTSSAHAATWTVAPVPDRRRGGKLQDCYFCTLDKVIFTTITEDYR